MLLNLRELTSIRQICRTLQELVVLWKGIRKLAFEKLLPLSKHLEKYNRLELTADELNCFISK